MAFKANTVRFISGVKKSQLSSSNEKRVLRLLGHNKVMGNQDLERIIKAMAMASHFL